MPRSREGKKARFLSALRNGSQVSEAASYAGLSRSTVYAWRGDDDDFAEEWDKAQEASHERLQRKAYEVAMGGNTRMLIFLLDQQEKRRAAQVEQEQTAAAIEIMGLPDQEDRGDADAPFMEFVPT